MASIRMDVQCHVFILFSGGHTGMEAIPVWPPYLYVSGCTVTLYIH